MGRNTESQTSQTPLPRRSQRKKVVSSIFVVVVVVVVVCFVLLFLSYSSNPKWKECIIQVLYSASVIDVSKSQEFL